MNKKEKEIAKNWVKSVIDRFGYDQESCFTLPVKHIFDIKTKKDYKELRITLGKNKEKVKRIINKLLKELS